MGSSSLVDTFATRLSAQPLNYRASAPGIQEVHLELLGGELYYITVGERDNDAKHKSSLLRLPTPRILPLAVASAPVRSHPHRYVMRTCAVRPPWVRPCIRFRQFLQPAARTSACARLCPVLGGPGPLNRTPHKGLLCTAARRSTAAARYR